MRIYYDTEFVEDGRTIAPLSIGLVAEDGRELYRVFADAGDALDRAMQSPWMRDNVLRHLPIDMTGSTGYAWDWDVEHPDWANTGSTWQVRIDVAQFIRDTPQPELWAWYGAYDHVLYAQLYGKMIDLPEGFPMWTNDLKQETHRLGFGDQDLPVQAGPDRGAMHNALHDARWVKATHHWLLDRYGSTEVPA